jgi:uncharacterized protein (DUF433 family)
MNKIVVNKNIMLGKPTIVGTRITVEQILNMLAQKLTITEILEDFPQLTENDIRSAVQYAAKKVANLDPDAVSYLHEISPR